MTLDQLIASLPAEWDCGEPEHTQYHMHHWLEITHLGDYWMAEYYDQLGATGQTMGEALQNSWEKVNDERD